MIVEEFVATLGLNFTGEGELNKTLGAMQSFKVGVLGVGAAMAGVVAGLTGVTLAVADSIDDLSDFADTVGTTVQQLQAFGLMGAQVGVSQEQMQAGLSKLTRSLQDAVEKGGESAKVFQRLGVRTTDASGKMLTLDKVMPQIADGLSKVGNATERAAISQDLFGRSGAKLGLALSKGSAGLAEATAQAEKFGIILDDLTVSKMGELSDFMHVFKMQLQGQFINPIAKVGVPLVLDSLKKLSAFFLENKKAIDSFISGFTRVAFGAFDGFVKVLGKVIDGISIVLEALGPVMSSMLGLGLILAGVFFSPLIAMGVFAGLLFLIFEDINGFLNGAPSLIGEVVDGWENFKASILDEEPKTFLGGVLKIIGSMVLAVGELGSAISALFNRDIPGFSKHFAQLGGVLSGASFSDVQAAGQAAYKNELTQMMPAGPGWSVDELFLPKLADPTTGQAFSSPGNIDQNVTIIVNANSTEAGDIGQAVREVIQKEMTFSFEETQSAFRSR